MLFRSGDWNNVMRYVNLTESLPYNIKIMSAKVSLEERDDESGSGATILNWEADIVLHVIKHDI